ncbi:MAG: xanthine dehydrogenase accessory protein XdhC [Bdellovibrionota bacterium]
MKIFWEAALELQKKGETFVVITQLNSRGHAPQDEGAKAIVTGAGLRWGTVGGGKVEARAIEYGRQICLAGEARAPEVLVWNLQRDIGMSCGGEVTYLFERFSTEWKLAVFGAGHVAQALVPLLQTLSCAITCIDSREDWLAKLPVAQNLRLICHPEPAKLVSAFEPGTFFISVSQGHAHDLPVLEAIFREQPDAPYIGVIGSDVKGSKIRKELLAKGIDAGLIEKLRCPIGLPFGSNHPGEIAISIAAELIQFRDRFEIENKKAGTKNGL